MRRELRFVFVLAVSFFVLVAGASALVAGDGGTQRYAVTVTNLTRGQILSPPVVFSHDGSYELFVPGEPASSELAQLAEDAASGPLLSLLGTRPEVLDSEIASGPIVPGESATVEIELQGRFRRITVAGMLVTTNDAFYSATGTAPPLPHGRSFVVVPRGTGAGHATFARWGATSFSAIAWDAGSEGNTESCDHIPGPPCDNPMVRVTESAEGFVHVHAGVHGGSSLAPRDFDWRNPVAHVRVVPIAD